MLLYKHTSHKLTDLTNRLPRISIVRVYRCRLITERLHSLVAGGCCRC